MSEKVITPDLGFVNEVIKAGGESLKKCYQCATCTVVCNMTPEDKPFPRKEMVQAQWGMKEELFRNPDIWLCHQCSDCTAYCPRGAKPGEVLGAVRKMSIAHYSKPSWLAKMVGDPKFLVPLIAIPVVIFLLILAKLGHLNVDAIPRGEGGKIVFGKFVPLLPYIDGVFILAFNIGAALLVLGIMGYWKDLCKAGAPQGSLVSGIIATVTEVLGHGRFGKCDVAGGRKLAHMLVFYGFIGLAITTGLSFFYEWVMHREGPFPMSDPIKWIGNVSAIATLVGIVLVIMNRLAISAKAGLGGYYDWLFIAVVATVAGTGFGAQLARMADMAGLAYAVYFAHLVSIFFLFAYAPYSKMAHMLYRGTAMVYANMTGRK